MFLRSPTLPRLLQALALLAPVALLGPACAEPGADEAGDELADEGEAPGPCSPGDTPSLEIGQGATAFELCQDGANFDLIHGTQGGVHILVALHAEDIDASEELEAELRAYMGEGDTQVGASFPYLNMRCNQDAGGQQAWNLFLIFDAQPEELHQQSVRVEAEVTDASGVVVSASKDIVIHDPLLE